VRWRRERAAPCEERGCGERKLGGGDDDDQCAGQGGRWILEEDICSARLGQGDKYNGEGRFGGKCADGVDGVGKKTDRFHLHELCYTRQRITAVITADVITTTGRVFDQNHRRHRYDSSPDGLAGHTVNPEISR
jgi:hypothetical protein